MRVNGHPQQDVSAAMLRHAHRERGASAAPRATEPPTTLPVAPANTSAATPAPGLAPVESTVDLAARKMPPGLVRVAARLEALGVEGRTGGQSHALTQITRNLQRYAENQGVAPAPTPTPTPTPAPSTAVPAPPTSSTGAVTPAPSAGDAAPVGTAPASALDLSLPVLA